MGTERGGCSRLMKTPRHNGGAVHSRSMRAKKRMTFDRIKGWYEAFGDDVYFSYSGGKDSTVLLEMLANFCKEYGYKFGDGFIEYK